MVRITPFQGFRYDPARLANARFADVVTPPYDVITSAQRQAFRARSPYNFSRVILPEAENGGSQYASAARTLHEWRRAGVVARDPAPSIYVYAQTYPANGDPAHPARSATLERLGFIALLDLPASEGQVLPHERTLQKPFEDRLALTRATDASLGLIFLLFDDRERAIDTRLEGVTRAIPPAVEFGDDEGVTHRLWPVSDPGTIAFVTEHMTPYSCIIADGHHRFKVACRYHEEQGEGARHVMACFVNSFNPGLLLRPTNRLVFPHAVPADYLARCREHFAVTPTATIHDAVNQVRATRVLLDKPTNRKNHAFALWDVETGQSYVLHLGGDHETGAGSPTDAVPDVDDAMDRDADRDTGHAADHAADTSPPPLSDPLGLPRVAPPPETTLLGKYHALYYATRVYEKTDINVLHRLVLEEALAISPADQYRGTKVEYVKGDPACIQRLQEHPDQYRLGLFVNPPLMREVFLSARAHETMPQKSTYFYPKLFSGLVFHVYGTRDAHRDHR